MLNFGKELYRVTKITIKDDTQVRMVNAGDTFVGQVSLLPSNRLNVGGLSGLLTSQVEAIKPTGKGNFLVETKNSVYTLELLND